ncbi:hypothetical protein AIN02nite_19810 [Acetobacter indonesiensis]|uniref:Uncharacterized protein n=1 Tax=Acetobacter indonesiensis TaxID=104101 RepID=A0A6N3T414_9PROT|nr:hypothetical protein Abin_085_002 [Acetobacter indonesiensis]GEN03956.1 hypothetical protein AIN02nite_19810 [Acetobacter indonesiensis]
MLLRGGVKQIKPGDSFCISFVFDRPCGHAGPVGQKHATLPACQSQHMSLHCRVRTTLGDAGGTAGLC